MIDWLTLHGLICFYDPKVIYNGATLELDENGEIRTEWKKPFAVEGSYSSKVYVRVDPRSPSAEMVNGFSFGSLEISGNPSKLLQGHNLFGTNDVQGVARAMILHVFKKLGVRLEKEEAARIDLGVYSISRVDINESWSLDNREQVLAALQSLERGGHLRYRGKGMMKGSTVYWGKHSPRWALKAYSKGSEIEVKGHGIDTDHPHCKQLTKHADSALRVELCLRGKELSSNQRRYDRGLMWETGTAAALFKKYFEKLEIADEVVISAAKLEGMPNRLQAAYQLWIDGHDLRAMYSHGSFYRYRRELKEYAGIDIANKWSQEDVESRKLVSLNELFEKEPMPIPDWARGTVSYFNPDNTDRDFPLLDGQLGTYKERGGLNRAQNNLAGGRSDFNIKEFFAERGSAKTPSEPKLDTGEVTAEGVE